MQTSLRGSTNGEQSLVVSVYSVYIGYVQYLSSVGSEPCLCWSLAALETLQITCVNWDQRLCLYISIWPYSWPIF